jgi:hypothetical protein
MPITYSHFSIIIKKQSILDIINTNEVSKKIEVAKNILINTFGDDNLIVIESMNSNLDDEKKLLNEMELIWNDGCECTDYYIPNEGVFTASWLEYARVKKGKSYHSTYRKVGDLSDVIYGYCGDLENKFPTQRRTLSRRNWGSIAREEGNSLYAPSWNALEQEARTNERVCPIPYCWNELHDIAIEADFNNSEHPKLPLILERWWDSSDDDKTSRFTELLLWAHKNQVSDVLWAYMTSLSEDEWHHKKE